MRYLGKRLLAAAIMVAVAGTICFFTIHLLPGDPVAMLLGEHGSKRKNDGQTRDDRDHCGRVETAAHGTKA